MQIERGDAARSEWKRSEQGICMCMCLNMTETKLECLNKTWKVVVVSFCLSLIVSSLHLHTPKAYPWRRENDEKSKKKLNVGEGKTKIFSHSLLCTSQSPCLLVVSMVWQFNICSWEHFSLLVWLRVGVLCFCWLFNHSSLPVGPRARLFTIITLDEPLMKMRRWLKSFLTFLTILFC